MYKVKKIVLTGGPCGGKTKAVLYLKTALESFGFNVILVTESAQHLISDGIDRSSPFKFQKAVAKLQIENEKNAEIEAQKYTKPVIICDRGLMDCRVYLNDLDFNRIKAELNMCEIDMRDRYDAVFHLDSTSVSNVASYKNGDVRTENEVQAFDLNTRSLKVWCGNPHYRFIPVCADFEEKMAFLLKEVEGFLGIPKPLEIEHKYLIKYPDIDYLLTLPCVKTEIIQTYLYNENKRFRLRKRGEKGNYIYIKTEKKKISETVREEVETRLTCDEYEKILSENNIIGTILKDRYCLMYNGTYYEIDVFPFWHKQAYLEVELLSEEDEITIPDFIDVIKEVTFDPRYKNISLCKYIPPEE